MTPTQGEIRTLADIESGVALANAQYPSHSATSHEPAAFAPEGFCKRCDTLAPLWYEWQIVTTQPARTRK